MEIVYAQQNFAVEGHSIFLAGPTPRDPNVKSWRPEALEILQRIGYSGTVFVPEMEGGFNKEFAYGNQIEWEHEALEEASVIVFWIPRDLKDMPAFTTNIEFGYWLAKDPSKLAMGFPEDAEKMNYIEYCINKYQLGYFQNLEPLLLNVVMCRIM